MLKLWDDGMLEWSQCVCTIIISHSRELERVEEEERVKLGHECEHDEDDVERELLEG